MFKIKYGVNTQDKFDHSTKNALQECFEEYVRTYGSITIDDIFEGIQEMLDTEYEEYLGENSCYMEFGYCYSITIKVVEIKQDTIKLELHY